MNLIVYPTQIDGQINAYPSKSITQRSIVASMLTQGQSVIYNPSYCEDSKIALKLAEQMGAKVLLHEDHWHIQGDFSIKNKQYYCAESGFCARFFAPLVALSNQDVYLDGGGGLMKRTMQMVEDGLKQMGVRCNSNNGFLPMNIKGPIMNSSIRISGAVSSQFLSGLLFACSMLENDSHIIVDDLKSTPYIDLTIDVLKIAGVEVENDRYEKFNIKGGQVFRPANYKVEGDWSGAAFMLIAGAISGRVAISNLSLISKQADMAILEALLLADVEIETDEDVVEVMRPNNFLRAFELDVSDCPDLVPALVVLALYSKGISRLYGVSRLVHKESARAFALVKEFSKLGAKLGVEDDELWVEGSELEGGVVDSHLDHRIAMALSIAALGAKNVVEIRNIECIAKSYPLFIRDLSLLSVVKPKEVESEEEC